AAWRGRSRRLRALRGRRRVRVAAAGTSGPAGASLRPGAPPQSELLGAHRVHAVRDRRRLSRPGAAGRRDLPTRAAVAPSRTTGRPPRALAARRRGRGQGASSRGAPRVAGDRDERLARPSPAGLISRPGPRHAARNDRCREVERALAPPGARLSRPPDQTAEAE